MIIGLFVFVRLPYHQAFSGGKEGVFGEMFNTLFNTKQLVKLVCATMQTNEYQH